MANLGAGVFRPQTLTDVLGALNTQSTAQDASTTQVNGLAGFAEADESATVSGAMTASAQVPPGWGQATWGAFAWA